MKNIPIKIKKYLKLNLVLFFVLGVFSSVIIQKNIKNFIKTEISKQKEVETNVLFKFEDLESLNDKNDLISLLKKEFDKSNLNTDLLEKLKNKNKIKSISNFSSIQSLENNKYLVGTNRKGFYLLEFNNNTNSFIVSKIKDDAGNKISELTTDTNVGEYSSIQSLENKKYLVGTRYVGFYLLEFNNENNSFTVSKIRSDDNIQEFFNQNLIGFGSSIQSLGSDKYLLGTNKGFYLLKFDNDTNLFTASKIKDNDDGNEISDLTTHDIVGQYSSIQSLGSDKYLIGTNNKGFYLLKFDDKNDSFVALKINNENNEKISYLTNGHIGQYSSIESLGNDKYLIGTNNKGFYLLKFDDKNNHFNILSINGDGLITHLKLQNIAKNSSIKSLGNDKYLIGTNNKGFYLLKFDDKNNHITVLNIKGTDETTDLKSGSVGEGSSVQSLKNNKYLVGTNNKGFYLLEFLDNDIFEVKNIIKNQFFIENLFLKKLLNEILKSKNDDDKPNWEIIKFFWKDLEELFQKIQEETENNNVQLENYSIQKLKKWLKLIIVFNHIKESNNYNITLTEEQKNIIKFSKWLKNKNWINDIDFKNLLRIKNDNPLKSESFNDDISIKDLDILKFYEYYDIEVWKNNFLDLTEIKVIQKTKEKLSNYFNTFETNLDVRKKIAKLIIEINKAPIYFFSDTGLTKESFEILKDGIGQMKIHASWNITLENLENYIFWINSLDENKYNELLEYRINELLTNNKKELILNAKKIIGNEDQTLEIIGLGFSHTDFEDDGSLKDNLSKEKLNAIKNWLIILKEKEATKRNKDLILYITIPIVSVILLIVIGYFVFKRIKSKKNIIIKK